MAQPGDLLDEIRPRKVFSLSILKSIGVLCFGGVKRSGLKLSTVDISSTVQCDFLIEYILKKNLDNFENILKRTH